MMPDEIRGRQGVRDLCMAYLSAEPMSIDALRVGVAMDDHDAQDTALLAGLDEAIRLFAEIEESVGCTCHEAYKSRGLTAPDCPLHSTGLAEILGEWHDAIDPLTKEQDDNATG